MASSVQKVADTLSTVEPLMQKVFDPDWCVREALLTGVGELFEAAPTNRNRRSARFVARILIGDRNKIVRMTAIEVLEIAGTRDDIAAIRTARFDKAWVVRASAYDAIAELGGPGAVGLIREGLDDKSAPVRMYCYEALARTGGRPCVSELASRLTIETDEMARIGLLGALNRLGERQHMAALAQLAKNPVMRVSETASRRLRELAEE